MNSARSNFISTWDIEFFNFHDCKVRKFKILNCLSKTESLWSYFEIANSKNKSQQSTSIIKRVSWFKSSLLLRIQSDSFTNINS